MAPVLRSNQVPDGQITPMLLEILRHKSAVAMMRLFLAAQKAAALDGCGIKPLFDFPLFHQVQKRWFVDAPITFVLLVGVEDIGRRREQGLMNVVDVADLLEKELEVVALRESGELGNVVETDIDDAFGTALSEQFEKLGGGLLGEADGVDGGIRIHHSMVRPSRRARFGVARRS